MKILQRILTLLLVCHLITSAQEKKTYIVPYAHLDTQWGWTYKETIEEYLPATLQENFELFEKYPEYIFNFEGAFRYMLIKEHYPDEYKTLKNYIAEGRWIISGSILEAFDACVPSTESLLRQIMYGTHFFKEEFGKTAVDMMLPDCFGFPYTLPTISKHCGLIGFSTLKFDHWGGYRPTPFPIGRWQGVDGSELVAALKPGHYRTSWDIREDDMNITAEQSGLYLSYDYFGNGDIGGSPNEDHLISLFERIAQNDSKEIKVYMTSSDQMFKDLSESEIAALPVYNGELIMRQHGVGCYTSYADLKRSNRKCELLGDNCERGWVIANHLIDATYPDREIKEKWIQFLIHQMHDDLPGTSVVGAYENYSRPDYEEVLAAFENLKRRAFEEMAEALDTYVENEVTDIPLMVFNPLSIRRIDPVEAEVTFAQDAGFNNIKVFSGDGLEVPSQIIEDYGLTKKIVFMATVDPVSYTTYTVRASEVACSLNTGISVTSNTIENQRYRVRIDHNGDVSSMYDKLYNKEIFESPSRFELRSNFSSSFPAWEIYHSDVTSFPRAYVDENVNISIEEKGPARVRLKVTRSKEGSSYMHFYSLAADSSSFLSVENQIDWRPNHSDGTLLKAAFPLTVYNSKTTYDLGLGTIQRGCNTESLYEVPGHQWADITSLDNSYGVAVLNDCKYGWDKPADNIINLTLIHNPNGTNYYYGAGDLEDHFFTYGIIGHEKDWSEGGVVVAAGKRLNQPLVSYQVTSSSGSAFGKTFSLLEIDSEKFTVQSIKKAEYSDKIIIRVREIAGKNWSSASIRFNAKVSSAEEMNGVEEVNGSVVTGQESITFDLGYYQLKTFAVDLDYSTAMTNPLKFIAPKGGQMKIIDLIAGDALNLKTRFMVPGNEPLKNIRIYDLKGRTVELFSAEECSDSKNSGLKLAWGESLSSGIYLISLKMQKYRYIQSVNLVR